MNRAKSSVETVHPKVEQSALNVNNSQSLFSYLLFRFRKDAKLRNHSSASFDFRIYRKSRKREREKEIVDEVAAGRLLDGV